MTGMGDLVGRKVTGILVDDDQQHYLTIETDQGPLWYGAEGDCCSESYFAELLNVRVLLDGGPVTAVEDMETTEAEGTRQESDTVYGFRVRVGDESAVITFRNSSNGYYGGWCGQEVKPPSKPMTPVLTDYRAG